MLGTLTRRVVANHRGLTLVELLVAMAIIGILAVIATPSFQDFILVQRLKSINAQLVTDLQFARAEAAARNQFARLDFRGVEANATGVSCYAIYTSNENDERCECDEAADSVCTGSARIVRTARIDDALGVRLRITRRGQGFGFAFDHVTGGIWTIPSDDISEPMTLFRVDAYLDDDRILRNNINQAGRVVVCAPASSTVGAEPCS
jgi:type IV fimbrial biogenesis protein FimT